MNIKICSPYTYEYYAMIITLRYVYERSNIFKVSTIYTSCDHSNWYITTIIKEFILFQTILISSQVY